MEMMLQTTDLCKSFRNQKAVNKVSLHIKKGKVYGLLGPNGAGKSTTLKMITGILEPTSGEIYFNGKPWSRESLSEMGALIENPPIGIEELRELIHSFPSKGITVILSSHILSEVKLLADDVGGISDGILGYEGPMEPGTNM